MAERRRQEIKFGAGSADGQRSSVWKVWARRDQRDVYVANQSLGGAIKVSIHETAMLESFTKEYHAEMLRLGTWKGPRRQVALPRPEVGRGESALAVRIVIPEKELRVMPPRPGEGHRTLWMPAPEENAALVFKIVLAGASFSSASLAGFLGTLSLKGDEKALLACEYLPVWDEVREVIELSRSEQVEKRKLDSRPDIDLKDPKARAVLTMVNVRGFFTFVEASSFPVGSTVGSAR